MDTAISVYRFHRRPSLVHFPAQICPFHLSPSRSEGKNKRSSITTPRKFLHVAQRVTLHSWLQRPFYMVKCTCFWALIEQIRWILQAFRPCTEGPQFAVYYRLLDLVQKGHNSLNITAFQIFYRRAKICWILQPFRSCTERLQFAEYYSVSDLVHKGHNSLHIIAFPILYIRATIRCTL